MYIWEHHLWGELPTTQMLHSNQVLGFISLYYGVTWRICQYVLVVPGTASELKSWWSYKKVDAGATAPKMIKAA